MNEGLFYVPLLNGSSKWPYPAARKQLFSDSSSGCSGAGEVAGQGRPGEGESPLFSQSLSLRRIAHRASAPGNVGSPLPHSSELISLKLRRLQF